MTFAIITLYCFLKNDASIFRNPMTFIIAKDYRLCLAQFISLNDSVDVYTLTNASFLVQNYFSHFRVLQGLHLVWSQFLFQNKK